MKRLARNTPHWEEATIDPDTGAVIAVDTYRPSAKLRRFLGARDLHCRYPGCRVPLDPCDIDHTVDAALGGATSNRNLAHLCRWHHVLKHQTAWEVKQDPDGTLHWTSPTGQERSEPPPGGVRFRRYSTPEPGPDPDPDPDNESAHPF